MSSGWPVIGRVPEVWRYPVKSMGGEQLGEVQCSRRGVEGDRAWAVVGADGKIGSGKTTRRFRRMPGLLSLCAFTDDQGATWVRFPDGDSMPVEDPRTAKVVGDVVGEPVTLVPEGTDPYFDDAPLHLVSSGSIRWLAGRLPEDEVERRRFRPNVVVEADGAPRPEEGWLGSRLCIGGMVAQVERLTVRCVMTTMSQPGLSFAPHVLAELTREVDACFGVYARVVEPGTVRDGDEVSWLGSPRTC